MPSPPPSLCLSYFRQSLAPPLTLNDRARMNRQIGFVSRLLARSRSDIYEAEGRTDGRTSPKEAAEATRNYEFQRRPSHSTGRRVREFQLAYLFHLPASCHKRLGAHIPLIKRIGWPLSPVRGQQLQKTWRRSSTLVLSEETEVVWRPFVCANYVK